MPRRGFTLIELLVAMAILSILATIGFGNFQSAQIKSRDVKRKSDLATIAKSLEAYVNDYRAYPLSDSDGKIVCQSGNVVCNWGEHFTDGKTTYAAVLPDDPTAFNYRYSSSGTSYTLYAHLENDNDPAVTTITPTVPCGTGAASDCNYKITSSNLP